MEFTAIFKTNKLECVEYFFEAKDSNAAIEFCKWKFSAIDICLLCHDDVSFAYLGNHDECIALKNRFLGKHGRKVHIYDATIGNGRVMTRNFDSESEALDFLRVNFAGYEITMKTQFLGWDDYYISVTKAIRRV